MANFDYDVPIRPDSVFHVASVSKQFAACSIHILATEGKLALEDDIRKYLPEMPEYEEVITIRHLIHHTSGLRDQWDVLHFAGWEYEGDLISNRHVLNMMQRQRGLNFKPGDEFLYSNAGYTLMALIVERCSGQSLRAFVDERLFAPLGMTSTHFHDDHNEIVHQRATGYTSSEAGGYQISIPTFDTVGATSLFTTVRDLTRWATNYLQRQVAGEAIEAMLEPYTLNSGQEIRYRGGITVDDYRGARRWAHSGGDAGYRSQFVVYPDHELSIVILGNVSSLAPGPLTEKIADLVLADSLEPVAAAQSITMTTEAMRVFSGSYHNPQTHEVRTLKLEGDQLVQQPDLILYPRREDYFQLGEMQAFYQFERDSSGVVTGYRLEARDVAHPYWAKVEPPAHTSETLAAYAGRYSSDELATFYDVVREDEHLILRHLRHADETMIPTHADAFLASDFMNVVFGRDASGQVQTLSFYTNRVRGITLQRVPDVDVKAIQP
jgi:CubicO group peptidase (beta-lactamase class C family)